jgi:hypothetical protein
MVEKKVTRLERFLRSRDIKPREVEREASYSRQALLKARLALSEPRRSTIAAIVSALRRITLEFVSAEDVFELSVEESGVWRKRTHALRLRRDERQRGESFVEELLRLPSTSWPDLLAARPDERNAGFLRALVLAAKRAIDRSPAFALPLAELAATLEIPNIEPAWSSRVWQRASPYRQVRGCSSSTRSRGISPDPTSDLGE